MSKSIIDNATGEVVNEIKFRSMWSNPYGLEGQDLSNEFEPVYEEVPAFAIDEATGEFLNKLSVPQIVATGKINVQEKIQSFRKEVDIYSILERYAYNEDPAILAARSCAYGDISEFPNDLNGYAKFVDIHFNNLKNMNPELADMVMNDDISAADIEKRANEIMQERIKENEKKEGLE